MQTTKQVLVLLAVGFSGALAWGQVKASGGVPVEARGVAVPVPPSFAAFPDVLESRKNAVRHHAARNVTDAQPYGDDPSGAKTPEARLDPAIDTSNPYEFTGSGSTLPGSTLPNVAVLRELDLENPYGAGLAAVEPAPIDADNPYVTGKR